MHVFRWFIADSCYISAHSLPGRSPDSLERGQDASSILFRQLENVVLRISSLDIAVEVVHCAVEEASMRCSELAVQLWVKSRIVEQLEGFQRVGVQDL